MNEMRRTPGAQNAIDAAFNILKDTPRPIPLSPTALEITRRDLEHIATTPHDLDTSSSHLPQILDPEHTVYILHHKIAPAAIQSSMTRAETPVVLSGREVDFLTEMLVPYFPDQKQEWVEARTAGALADYTEKTKASEEESRAYEVHARNIALTQLGVREGIIRELHEGYEKLGGHRRQSYIERIKLFEA